MLRATLALFGFAGTLLGFYACTFALLLACWWVLDVIVRTCLF